MKNIKVLKTDKKRIVIIGAGFAGLKLARSLKNSEYEIVLIDKRNYHQFQPLFYQVATSGLEPSSISFPLRKIFQKCNNVHIRLAEVKSVDNEKKVVITNIGEINYDILVFSQGADTNFFGMQNIKDKGYAMKSTPEALEIRNSVLRCFEDALTTENEEYRQSLMNIAIVGGGATGVELAGALAEMKNYILPQDYPELDFSKMNIYLIEAGEKLLANMSAKSSEKVHKYMDKLGVKIMTKSQVKNYDGNFIYVNDNKIPTKTVIWAAGIIGNKIEGLKPEIIARSNRIKVNNFNLVEGYTDIYAIGDIAYMTDKNFPNAHPQVAQVAIQQANNLSVNLKNLLKNKEFKPFVYKDLGSMATVGRNLAVVDLPRLKFQGFLAWVFWLFIHLMSIVGVKNRIFIFINWFINYFTYDQSLRLILSEKRKNE